LKEYYEKIYQSSQEYIQSFTSDDESVKTNYRLKAEHIGHVVENVEMIAADLGMEESQLFVAKTIALLHDIGRFEQFQKYQTFNDSASVDHAELALQIIESHGWLGECEPKEAEIIKAAIVNHNKHSISKTVEGEKLVFCKIIRDADKLDILDLAVKEYSTGNRKRNSAFTLELEDSQRITPSVSKSLLAGKLPDKKELNTVADFKLMQIAYVFDIYFKKSFAIINKKQYLRHIFDTLPKSDLVFEMYRKAKIHIENHLM
jgi:hypothetical protein